MNEILQIIQEKYVPKKVVQNHMGKTIQILSKIFVGGDQLSEENARHAQGAMADGETEYDRVGGIFPKNEDWHAIRYMYVVSKHILTEKIVEG